MLLIQRGYRKEGVGILNRIKQTEMVEVLLAGAISVGGASAAPASLALTDAFVILLQPLLLRIPQVGCRRKAHPTTSLVASSYSEAAAAAARIIEIIVHVAIPVQAWRHAGHGKHFLLLQEFPLLLFD